MGEALIRRNEDALACMYSFAMQMQGGTQLSIHPQVLHALARWPVGYYSTSKAQPRETIVQTLVHIIKSLLLPKLHKVPWS